MRSSHSLKFGFRGFFVASSSASAQVPAAFSEEPSLRRVVTEEPLFGFFLVVGSLPPFILADVCVVKVEHDVESEFCNDNHDECKKESAGCVKWREKVLLIGILCRL